MKELGAILELYDVPRERAVIPTPGWDGWAGGGQARRYWIHDRILVGGSILGEPDGKRLRDTYGVTHVLSFEAERRDEGKGFPEHRICWAPFIDVGTLIDEAIVHKALDFVAATLAQPGTVLYAHCQLGGSRGPSAGYLACVGALGLDRDAVLAIMRGAHPHKAPPHQSYIDSIDKGIATWRARRSTTVATEGPMIDLLITNSIGPGFTLSSSKTGLGGSELEIVQVAHALARRGHKVVVANGVETEIEEEGVRYIPLAKAAGMVCRTLWIERNTVPPPGIRRAHTVLRATDINWSPFYDQVAAPLESGERLLAVNTEWHRRTFPKAKRAVIIPPVLDTSLGEDTAGPVKRVPGRFVFVSAPMKGMKPTIELWREIMARHPELVGKAHLQIVSPKYADFYGDQATRLEAQDKRIGIEHLEPLGLVEYRRLIASAEGLFFVNQMVETFGCAVAFAERFGARPHVLCLGEEAGLAEALSPDVRDTFLTRDKEKFIGTFVSHLGKNVRWVSPGLPDLSADALAPAWEDALRLPAPRLVAPEGKTAAAILRDFKKRLLQIRGVAGTVTDYWRERASVQVDFAKTKPIEDFLRWSTDVDGEELPEIFQRFYAQLKASADWETRWHRLTRKEPHGNPHDFSLDAGASPMTVQHAHTLMEYERETGERLIDGVDVVFEFGGGHGNLARVLREDGFHGTHIILDLPHAREIQRAYLRLAGVPVSTTPKIAPDGGVLLILEKDIEAILPQLKGKRTAFVAMWSLSEAPLALRNRLFPVLHEHCVRYLVQSQWPRHQTEPLLSNEDYFTKFMAESGKPFAQVNPGWAARSLYAPSKTRSLEGYMTQEDLPKNREPMPPEFGGYLGIMRKQLAAGGSEYGLGLGLMMLVAATRAAHVVEIGRFRGFSTVSLAAGLALADEGWQETKLARERPDVDYIRFLGKRERKLRSIEIAPTQAADEVLASSGLGRYVEKINVDSNLVNPAAWGPIDVLFIDGGHSIEQARADIAHYVPFVRPNGYFVLHDYFGWWRPDGSNGSAVKQAIDEDLVGFERVLIDTGFASFCIFRKTADLLPQPAKVPAREDGRPTVGLVLIAHGDEAATIIARAIVTIMKEVDAVTVVLDSGDHAAEVCRALGADVYQRPTPKFDWERGIGSIAGARNEAIAIAERKTDYLLMLDPDDMYEGVIPKRLEHDAYEVTIHDGPLRYQRIQMFRSGMGARYYGVAHEGLTLQPGATVARLGPLIYRRGHGGTQDQQTAAVKYGKHAKWFERYLFEHPEDARAQFYLGQSYRDSGQGVKAIEAYEKRIAMDGWDEERWYSALQIARIIVERGDDPTSAYLRAYDMRPSRAEPLFELACWLKDDKRRKFALAATFARQASLLPMPQDAMFIQAHIYEWAALQEYAIAVYWAGDKAASRDAYKQLVERVPEELKAHMEKMLDMTTREAGK